MALAPITFDRDPWGFTHPFYKRRQLLEERMNEFFKEPVGALTKISNLLEMDHPITFPHMENKGDKFEMKVDVQQFSPKELDVKLVDNFLVVEGKHEEKQDEHGFVSRHFQRKCLLPPDVKPETITCDLSTDGVLQISAPKQTKKEINGNEKVIPIKYTGLPALTDGTRKDKDRSIAAAC